MIHGSWIANHNDLTPTRARGSVRGTSENRGTRGVPMNLSEVEIVAADTCGTHVAAPAYTRNVRSPVPVRLLSRCLCSQSRPDRTGSEPGIAYLAAITIS